LACRLGNSPAGTVHPGPELWRVQRFDQLSPSQLDALRDINETLARHLIPSLGVTPPPVLACRDATTSG
jgi:hypothetical protein